MLLGDSRSLHVKEIREILEVRRSVALALTMAITIEPLEQDACAVGSTSNATAKALGKLFKAGLVARPQKGLYSSTGRPAQKTTPPKPAPAAKPMAPKPAETAPVLGPSLSVMTMDLLVEGEAPKIDTSGLLEKVRGIRDVLDARVSKVAKADQSKLQVRFACTDKS